MGAARLKTLRLTGEGTGHTFGQAHEPGGASRPVEIHRIAGSPHSDSLLMICVPREKLLTEADACTPAAPNTLPPAVANLNNPNPIANIGRLGPGVDRILPLHGRVVPLSEPCAAAGRALPR